MKRLEVSILTFYEVLNVKNDATDKEIKKAYRLLAKKYHPDTYDGNKEFAEDKMQEINIAYDTLSNPVLREKYNEKIGFMGTPKTETTTNNKTSYKSAYNHYRKYDKDGVNYEVKYRPNNSRIRYNSEGYAESNYYTEQQNANSYKEEIDFKAIFSNKQKLVYILIIVLVGVIVFGWAILKAKEHISQFPDLTSRDSAKSYTSTTKNEINRENELENIINKIKKESEENEIRHQVEPNEKKDVLSEWGIKDEETQKKVLEFIEGLKNYN